MTIKKLAITTATMAMMTGSLALPAMAQELQQYGAAATAPAQDTTATLSFEVKTDCAPPEGTTLLGYVPAEGLISAVLSDPDGDGTYTGSVEVPRFAPGPRPEGTEPVSVPVLIGQNVGDNSGNIQTIKDFGQVKLDGDEAFSASASFCGSGQYGPGGGTTGPATDPPQGAEPTASFELKTDCAPPAGTKFFAGASQQTAALEDPDGDGVYTGSLTLPEGFYDLGAFPVPVAILSGTLEVPNQQTIKYFGEKVLENGDAFSANASFCDGGGGGSDQYGSEENAGIGGGTPIADEGTTSGGADETTGPEDAVPGTERANEKTIAVVSGGATDANKGGSASADGNGSVSAFGGAAKGGAPSVAQGGTSPIASVLPSTGGVLPIAGLAGLALVAGGLLFRRISR